MLEVFRNRSALRRDPDRKIAIGAVRGPIARRPRIVALVAVWVATVLAAADQAPGATLVSFDFAGFGTVLVDLFDDLTPITIANHMKYLDVDRYDGTMIHRVDTGLGVIQGGGFNVDASSVSTFLPIVNEYSRANTRGTISMARTANVDSATSQWFINTADNTDTLGQSNGGGFAVFGWVVGGGMSVIDDIAAVPTFTYASPFGQIPLQNFTQQNFENGDDPFPHVVELSSVSVVKTHAAYQNPFLDVDVNNSNSLEPLDALVIVNQLIANGDQILAPDGPFSGSNYLDVTGNGLIEPLDALRVFNALIAQSAADNNLVAPLAMSSSIALVPEPSTLVLAGAGALALAGCMLARRRRRRG